MLRKLRTFHVQIESYNTEAEADGKELIVIEENPLEAKDHMDELEAKFTELETQITELNTHQEQLNRNHHQLVEISHVLRFSESTRQQRGNMGQGDEDVIQDDEGTSLITDEGKFQVKFGSITGVVLTNKFHSFEKILFRATRGNLFLKYEEIEELVKDPVDGKLQKKTVFVVFYQGERLGAKIQKICESFGVNVYQCPETQAERTNSLSQVRSRLEMLNKLLEKGWQQRTQILRAIAMQLVFWKTRVTREKMIYHTMNKFNYDLGRRCLIAEGWCPVSKTEDIQYALRLGKDRSGAPIPSVLDIIKTDDAPPTHFQTNFITSGFNDIVSSYGVARYREINPTVFTVVTFPFEFAVMFGDVGHGALLLIAALLMIYMERHWEGKKINEMIEMAYAGRYTILLMAIWSIYIGSLYNECFALPMNFGSNYKLDFRTNTSFWWKNIDWTYLWGVDPVWKGATNELLYYNSLKMKTSVIIGILQMTLGLCLHLLNSIHFNNMLDVFFEFVPRVIFLWSTFGYLVFIIFVKWNTNYFAHGTLPDRTNGAPGLLNVMISMFLGGNNTGDPMYPGQAGFETFLYYAALICIPLMFFPKPFVLHLSQNARKAGYPNWWTYLFSGCGRSKQHAGGEEHAPILAVEGQAAHGGGGHGGHGHEEDVTELWVHQGLETIEFALGCISHTASYLRLWALSLAHSELSTVFYDKIVSDNWAMAFGFSEHGEHGFTTFLMLTAFSFIGVSGWLAVTFGIIMAMEVLSAFLHALRLHWVEFQSKFYRGDGHLFKPFVYKTQIFLDDADEELI